MGMSHAKAVQAVGCTPTDLSEYPWVGLLWDSTNERMLTTKENQNLARRLLYNALGGNLAKYPYRTTLEDLKKEFAGILNRAPGDVSVPNYQPR